MGLNRINIEIEYEPVTILGVVLSWRSPLFSGNDHARTVGVEAHADALIVSVTNAPFTNPGSPVLRIVPVPL
jgi:hypothetical protein